MNLTILIVSIATSMWGASAQSNTDPCPGVTLPTHGSVELRVLVIKGSQWDRATFQASFNQQIQIASRLVGLTFNPTFVTLDEPNAIDGFGDGETDKGIYWFNKLGDEANPTLIFTGKSGPWQAIINGLKGRMSSTMAATFVTSTRGSILKKEGVVFLEDDKEKMGKTLAHELGHLLGRITGANNHSLDPREVMYGREPGCSFSDPWRSAVLTSKYVKPLPSAINPTPSTDTDASR